MGQTICRMGYSYQTGSGGKTTQRPYYECSFEESPWFLDIFEGPPSTIYKTAFDIADLVLLALLWLLTSMIKHSDFSQSFVISNLLTFSVFAIFCFVLDFKDFFWSVSMDINNGFHLVGNIIYSTLVFNFLLTLIIFMAQNLRVARVRQPCKLGKGYLLLPPIILVLVSSFTFLPIVSPYTQERYINGIFQGLLSAVGIIEIICLCALCCCSDARIGQSAEPSVANAKARMGWSLLFSIFAVFPFSLTINFNYILRSFYRMNLGYSNTVIVFIVHIVSLINYLAVSIFAVSVILFLPAYRSVLFCSQGYYTRKIADVEATRVELIPPKKPQASPSAPIAPSAPLQTLAIPTNNQPSSPFLNYQGIQDFGTVLTNPPNAVSCSFGMNRGIIQTPYNPIQPSAPLASVNQQCICPHGNPLQPIYIASPNPVEQFQLVQHHPVVAAHPQHIAPMSQGPLVRFASQPNLATVGTLQPAVSMPHIIQPSPFYIAN